jgi:hypothetical protein
MTSRSHLCDTHQNHRLVGDDGRAELSSACFAVLCARLMVCTPLLIVDAPLVAVVGLAYAA